MKTRILLASGAALLLSACVEHRPIRNTLSSEAVYLDKAGLTQPDTTFTDPGDVNWIYRTTVVGASSPNVVGNYAFPGVEGSARLVRFRFRDNALQMVNAQSLMRDDAADPNDDLATTDDNVLLEFAGQHVDVKLHENLDGERTNLLEENTELPWEQRQKFRVDFSSSSMDPITNSAWFYGELLSWCASTVAVHYVPDSFSWENACDDAAVQAEKDDRKAAWDAACDGLEADSDDCKAAQAAVLAQPMKCSETGGEAMNLELEVTYNLTIEGGCYDLVTLATGTGTSTIRYHLSFYRPRKGTYVPEEIGEKDIVNKKYGVFQNLNLFRDHDTGLLSAKSLIQRWDPNRTDPVVYYFHPGVPPAYKKQFADEIAPATNKVLEDAGAKLRIQFKDWNDGGIDRKHGDMRYSFINWHHDIDTTLGLLGYGPSTPDPRTGEVLSATVNLYNIGLDTYRFRIQNFLESEGGLAKPDETKAWEDTECTAGATVQPADPIRCDDIAKKASTDCAANNPTGERDCDTEAADAKAACLKRPRLASGLFEEMRNNQNLPTGDAATWEKSDFLPTPQQPDFDKNYQRVLPELRFAEPGWNPFVYGYQSNQTRLADFLTKKARHAQLQTKLDKIVLGENPFANVALSTKDGIEAQLKFGDEMREWRKLHQELADDQRMLFGRNNVELFDDQDAITAISRAARKCVDRADGKHTWESDKEYSDRIIEHVVFKTGIHEFGHTMGLRHNFYGSADAVYIRPGGEEISASVMDYVSPVEEAATHRGWGRYDELAMQWIYGTQSKRDAAMKEHPLYCTDEHVGRSPLCRQFDLGVTPSQIVLNAIEQYDWLYELRNKRAYRKFWDTSAYVGAVYDSIYSIQRMWYLALFDWGGGGVQDMLKSLDQVDDPTHVKTDLEYDQIATDFYSDVGAAIGMTMSFYDAVLNQPASTRNYQTEFDPYYGDVLRIGIIIDKLFATFAFMDLQDVSGYNPNLSTYVTMYDAPFNNKNDALSQRVLDDMLGANYDTFPWFKYYALNIFASVTNTNLFTNTQYRDRIAIKRYDRASDLEAEFGQGVIAEATRSDNISQTFVKDGEEYVYTYVTDRAWHLVAAKSKSPVSYQFIKEYNENLNGNGDDTTDNYGLKILLAYYEYFNNFVGY